MFTQLGGLVARRPWLVCAAWLLAGIALAVAAPSWDKRSQDDDVRFLPASCPSVRGYQLLEQAFPQDVFASRAIFAIERGDGPLTKNDFALVDRLVEELNKLKKDEPELQIGAVYSYKEGRVGNRLTSADKKCTLIQMSLGTPYLAVQTRTSVDRAEARLRQVMKDAGPDAPRMLTTGAAGIGRDLIRSGGDGLDRTTVATIILV